MYSFLFAHPLVEAITGWDFADGAWLGAPSGVIRKDNSLKPSYHLLDELIHKRWHTDLVLTTDSEGRAKMTGFRGDYKASLEGNASTFKLTKESGEISITL